MHSAIWIISTPTCRAGTNIEIYLGTFANNMFEHSKFQCLAFKLQVYLYLCTSFLSFILFNKFANIWKVHSSSIEWCDQSIANGVSAILQSCIGEHQLMAKRMFTMHYLRCFKVTTTVAS